MKNLIFVIISLFFVSCAHKMDINNQNFVNFKEYSLGSEKSELANKHYRVAYSLGCKNSCFETCNDSEEIITASPNDIDVIIDYLYRSEGSFNIKKVTYNHTNKVTVKANDEMKIHYQMALCKEKRALLFMFEEEIRLVSYKITKKEILK